MTTRFENRVKVQQHHLAACTPQSRHGGTAYYSPPWLSGTPEFEWNYFLLEPLRRFRDTLDHRQRAWWNSRFFELSLSQGYFGCRELGLGGEKVLLTVVSRRGWRRAGTRFEKRGIDEEGNVANFVETETILQSPSRAIAFTQVRGSVPLVWQERLHLTGPVDLSIAQPVLPSSLQSFQRHINHLVMSYRQIHILSLLSDLDSGRFDAEAILGDAYCLLFWTRAQLGDRRAEDVVSFQSYPIHVDQLDSARAQSLPAEMEQNLKAVLDVLGATVSTIDGEGRMTLKEEQRGVFRVNCRDCLDRSNLAAYSLSAATLKLRYGVDAPDLALTSEDAQQLAKAHRELFAENGDTLSQFYAGSAAMNSDLIRTGVYSSPHQEVTNAWNAEKRNGQAIFHDKAKNRAIEVLTGQYRKQESQPVLVRFDKKDGFLVVPELSDAPSASFPFFPPPVARS